LVYEVVAYIYVFDTLFLNWIGDHEDGILVVSIEWYGFHRVTYLF
jgi:hypothetical protein